VAMPPGSSRIQVESKPKFLCPFASRGVRGRSLMLGGPCEGGFETDSGLSFHPFFGINSRSARARSSRQVILRLRTSPGTAATGFPRASTAAASSVRKRPRRSASA